MKEEEVCEPSSEYGFHRVLVPHKKGSLIQAAVTVENEPRILNEYEVLIDVEYLHLDSTSMKQIQEIAKSEFRVMKDKIFGIIEARGKMHNPATNSGGVLVGKVKEIGKGNSVHFDAAKLLRLAQWQSSQSSPALHVESRRSNHPSWFVF